MATTQTAPGAAPASITAPVPAPAGGALSLDADALFLELAASRGWIDAEGAAHLRGLRTLDRMCGRTTSFARLARAEGIIAPERVRLLEERILYEAARRVDKAYGRIALEKGFLDKGTLAGFLAAQKRAVVETRVMRRLPALLSRAGVMTTAQDEETRAALAAALEALPRVDERAR